MPGHKMGHGFLPVLPSGETLCVRNQPSSSAMVGSNEGLQCPDYKIGFVSSALPVHGKILSRQLSGSQPHRESVVSPQKASGQAEAHKL